MAKRELSSTLKNLKFMQRAVQKEDKPKKEVIPDVNISSPTTHTHTRKCVVIIEGNPHPGAIKGRMSFQTFNPSIDKLHEEVENPYQPKDPSASTGDGKNIWRKKGSSCSQPDESNECRPDHDYDGDYKRKHPESAAETQYPNKSPKSATGEGDSISPNNRNGPHRQKKREKLDWNLLRPPPKVQDRTE